jgi:hypothetical protein
VFHWTQCGDRQIRHPLEEGGEEWADYLCAASGDRYALLEFVKGDSLDALRADSNSLRRWLN